MAKTILYAPYLQQLTIFENQNVENRRISPENDTSIGTKFKQVNQPT
jgi:hypothetical protein